MNFRAPMLVGLLLLIAGCVMVYFVTFTSKERFSGSDTYVVYADFVDASGVRLKTRVQINGIDVGRIDEIQHHALPDGRLVARVTLRLSKDYVLYQNASVKKAAESLLGDFRIDVNPGTSDQPVLPAGGVVSKVQSLSDLDQIQSDLSHVVKNVSAITDSFSKVLAGPEGEGSLRAIMERVEKSMEAIESTTRDVGRVASRLANATEQGGDVNVILERTASLAARLDRLALSMQTLVTGDEDKQIGDSSSLKNTLTRLNQSVERLNNVMTKVDEGAGTLGRLVNDPGISDKIEQTVEDAGDLIGGVTRLQAQIELRSEYGVPVHKNTADIQPGIKNTLQLRLLPRPDRFFSFELVSDPRGVQKRQVTTRTPESTGGERVIDETVTSFNDLRFSAEFAKRYYFAALRFGIIENTGGLGTNLYAFNDTLEARLDAFDFNRRDITKANRPLLPRLRGRVMYHFLDHLFVQAGLDDPLNSQLFTWFVGGGIRFTDDDLRSILIVAPRP